ncbi:MAG: multicopper oxidase family protein [Hyphomicrobium sp.]
MATRRRLMQGAAATLSVAALPFARGVADASVSPVAPPPPIRPAGAALPLDIAERNIALPCFAGQTLPLLTFRDDVDVLVVRVKVDEPFDVAVKNSLQIPGEHVSIHWHGLRIENRQDGVSYMTQPPIQPGETGGYRFTPPDTGTYFFHTHCNSVEHFGRGLVGALIVEGDEIAPSDADVVLMMKDWRLAASGGFMPFSSDEGAAKAGTNGTVRAINGVTRPRYAIPASADVRIRFLNVDPVRISEIGVEGAEAALIAVDGNGLAPMTLESWRLGPAGRLDILVRSPKAGGLVRLIDYFSAEPVVLAEFISEGPDKRRGAFEPAALKSQRVKLADRANAQRLTFDFSATATGKTIADLPVVDGLPIGKLCLAKRSYWAINKQSWVSVDHSDLGPPLAKLKLGQSYIFELENRTPHSHPIHIHGHTFEVMNSNLRKLTPHRADTILLVPKERIEVAFVADNPGRWMFHCHILEHQETGMMGYLDVA